MAPKTRHLAQGKRKKTNRRPVGGAATPQSVASQPDAVAPLAIETTPNVDPLGHRSPGQPMGPEVPVQKLVSRRSTTGRGTRPYQSINRSIATVNTDVQRPNALPRETEYAFIRSDMRRLFYTAGSLTILMIVLLFVLDR